jgi:hypothetical protein
MFRDAGLGVGFHRFTCPLPVWDLLWELGRAFGWRPQGTTYVMSTDSTLEAPARRNYQPGDSQDHKQVDEEDALAWARALVAAKASPHFAAMVEARSAALLSHGKTVAELLPAVLDEFIEFAYGGAFQFAIRRERARTEQDENEH